MIRASFEESHAQPAELLAMDFASHPQMGDAHENHEYQGPHAV